ncbi:TonB-dependent receptor [Orrella sp. JC864]|uniref:TonB-dependent receptor n=1 Tax=Orrella sp. JC864 TaxID=3120298 RepID=UPI003008BCF7
MKKNKLVLALAAIGAAGAAHAQGAADTPGTVIQMQAVRVQASADASAEGLAAPYAGGQVATGGRIGILGTRDNMETPFSVTSYTNELIQDRQARSVADVLQNDPGVRMGRGFGNFQETYFIRGFILYSDDIAYNGLYGMLPRQYIASEFFERVEVLRGASTFLSGAAPAGTTTGGAINLVPKRAPNEPLTRVTAGAGSGGQASLSTDVARRYNEDRFGIRFNAVARGGDTAVDDESSRLGAGLLGLDWRGENVRLSADIGWQDNRLKRTRPSVRVSGLDTLPDAPKASSNWAQSWTHSNERDTFATLRGEYDFNDRITGWAAFGVRDSKEDNLLAGLSLTDGRTGDGTSYRFDNVREELVHTGEVGLRAKARTGAVGHEFVVSANYYDHREKNAAGMTASLATNLYEPVSYAKSDFGPFTWAGGDLDDPGLLGRTRTRSFALGDTMSFVDERVLLTLGLRHQRIATRSYNYSADQLTDSYAASRNSPAAGLVFKIDPRFSVYANYIENLVKGATAPSDAINAGTTLKPYVSRQKEIGLKYDGGSLGAGLALFSTNRKSGQMDENDFFSASGEDRHQGAELTVFGEAARNVRVLGGVTWLDAKRRDTGTEGLDGKRVIGVPRWQANLGAEWDIPGVDGLTVDGRLVYTGSSYADAANTLRVPSWTRFDAGLRYVTDVADRLVVLRARVENIANRDYWATVGGYPGQGHLTLGTPRTFWLSASMEF